MADPAIPTPPAPTPPAAGAPPAAAPAAHSDVPPRDWAADLAAAEKRAAAAEKAHKGLEAKLAESTGVLEKLKAAFGGESKDPAAELAALRGGAEQATSQARAYQALAMQAIRNAAITSVAAREWAIDPEDVVLGLAGSRLEVDLESGRVKDPADVDKAVAAFKARKAHMFRQPAAPVTPAPIAGKITAPGMPPQADPAPESMSPLSMLTTSLRNMRTHVTGKQVA